MARIAWGITGCGDKIEAICNLMVELKKKHNLNIDVYASKSAKLVLKWYKVWGMLEDEFYDLRSEVDANSPFLVGKLQTGHYDMFIVAPATANTAAKIACGIADTLLTSSVAMAAKARVPVYIFPPDNKPGELVTILPGGKRLTLYIREVDVENVNRIRKMECITVLDDVEAIRKAIEEFVSREKAIKG